MTPPAKTPSKAKGLRRLLMIDSGAFSVWNKGSSIDLEGYVDFCKRHPGASCYVNLDVIPGVPNNKRTITPTSLEDACQRGWNNYQRMLKDLPLDKVIPVFHQNENPKWLKRYLDFGTPYLGISPANDRGTPEKLHWMKSIRPLLFDKDGAPRCKTHGFAVTSFRLMKYWQWYSVDSASWKVVAAWGGLYLPRKTGGKYDYGKSPYIVAVSPMSPSKHKRGKHVTTLSPLVRELLDEYLECVGEPMGRYEIVTVPEGHRVGKTGEQFWYDRKKSQVLQVVERGVACNWELRAKCNAFFLREVMRTRALPVKHIYFAGAPRIHIEQYLGKRLMTYHDLMGCRKGNRILTLFQEHLSAVENGERW